MFILLFLLFGSANAGHCPVQTYSGRCSPDSSYQSVGGSSSQTAEQCLNYCKSQNYLRVSLLLNGGCYCYNSLVCDDSKFHSDLTGTTAYNPDDSSCSGTFRGCKDSSACNYNSNALTSDFSSCTFAQTNYDCDGNCLNDADADGVCDEVDSCVGTLDTCGVCNGPGDIYECGCSAKPAGDCDCNGKTLDACGTCGGDGSSCTACLENQYVSNHTCKNCSMLTRKKAGGLTSGEDTSCVTKDWVVVTASALGGSVLGVGGVLWWHYTQGFKYSLV